MTSFQFHEMTVSFRLLADDEPDSEEEYDDDYDDGYWSSLNALPVPQEPQPAPDTILGDPFEAVDSHYRLGRELGKGGSATAYFCTEKSTGEPYACKTIWKRNITVQEDEDDVRREVQILKHLTGETRIAQFKAVYEDARCVHIIMELCTGGELFDRIIASKHFTERHAAATFKDIMEIIQTCHSMGVIHRDIRPENFLYSTDGEGALLKLIDFGLSTFTEEGKIHDDIVGAPYYLAPEVINKNHGKEADIWSAGVVLYILLCGVPPFWAAIEKDIFPAILKGKFDFERAPWPTTSSSAKDLVRKMLTLDPKQRITSEQVLAHPWFGETSGEPSSNSLQ